jgi:hypothetical protein
MSRQDSRLQRWIERSSPQRAASVCPPSRAPSASEDQENRKPELACEGARIDAEVRQCSINPKIAVGGSRY